MKRRAKDTAPASQSAVEQYVPATLPPRSLVAAGLLELTVTHDRMVDAEHPHVETRTCKMAFNAARVITATPHSDGQGTTLFTTGNRKYAVTEPYHTVLARWQAALTGGVPSKVTVTASAAGGWNVPAARSGGAS